MSKSSTEVMARDHWAIIKPKTTYHEGDERSRTHPGHGYPAHTTSNLHYVPFETEEELLIALERKRTAEKWTVMKATVYAAKASIELVEQHAATPKTEG